MRITQGTFSFLPDLTDDQIAAQIAYALGNGWSMSVEHTDDPHPRNSYWEMWAPPVFDLPLEELDVVMREVRACREAHPNHYVKLNRLRLVARSPDDRAQLHRQPPRTGAGIPARPHRGPRSRDPLPVACVRGR